MARMQWWIRPGPSRPCAISKPRPGPGDDALGRQAHVLEEDLGVAVRFAEVSEHRQHPQDLHTRAVHRDEHHRVALVAVGLGIGDTHEDQEPAPWIAGTAGPPLLSVEHDLVAVHLAPSPSCWWRRWRPPPARSSRSRNGSRRPSSGTSHCSFCRSEPYFTSTSALPVSGAAQLKTSGARKLRPVSSATGA